MIRVGVPDDAAAMLEYLECVSGESDFLTFGPGEFEMTAAQEAAHLATVREAPDHLHIVATDGARHRGVPDVRYRPPAARAASRRAGDFGTAVALGSAASARC